MKVVIAAYERVRAEALKDPAALKAALFSATKLPEPVVGPPVGAYGPVAARHRQSAGGGDFAPPGLALQQAGVIAADVDVAKAVDGLIDPAFKP